MNLVIIDGQGGGLGRLLVQQLKAALPDIGITAIGTNAMATAAMLKAGAVAGATGENAVIVACRDADIIAGPIGIVMADALMGEVTPRMAQAVCASRAIKLLCPLDKCHVRIVGSKHLPMTAAVEEMVGEITSILQKEI